MGNCAGSKKQNKREVVVEKNEVVDLIKVYDSKELRSLKLIYSDLASRSSNGKLSMENFLLFFHKKGYWGERLFKEFVAGQSNFISEEQFIRGIVKIFKTTEEKKIELLYKFFSDPKGGQGVSYNNFLTMVKFYLKQLYNYPKQDLNKILNDADFINKQLKGCLISIDNQLMGRRLMSLSPEDALGQANGKAFRLDESQANSQNVESKYGAKIIHELNKQNTERRTTVNIKVGQNNVEIKTTSVHQLVKKFARSIFKNYGIDPKTGRLSYENFRDWVTKHKNLYNDYYKGFHSEVWQVDKVTGNPVYSTLEMEYSSLAKVEDSRQKIKVNVSLLHSILIVSQQSDPMSPVSLICLEGLAANPFFDSSKGHGVELVHRDGIYPTKKFYLQSQQMQKGWMQVLKFFKGRTINQVYDIKEQIGMGRFSVVYSCVQKSTGQKFAIKVIESFKLDNEAKKIIAHESSIMSVMSHPLLVFFKETITTKTHIYIVTQLVKGKDLFDFVRELKFLEETEAAYILQQIIIGVRYIHSLGIVHRDLKPQNIMLEYDEKTKTIGRIKIIDFGFANYQSRLSSMSRDQLWAGTPNYIAPEVLREETLNQRIDNFAIGSILYYILSGNLPFNSADIAIILQKTLEGAFPLNDKRWKTISEEAKDLVSKLLENNPADRIPLDEALKHPWIKKHRQNRQTGTSLTLSKKLEIEQKDNGKVNPLIY